MKPLLQFLLTRLGQAGTLKNLPEAYIPRKNKRGLISIGNMYTPVCGTFACEIKPWNFISHSEVAPSKGLERLGQF